MKLWEELIIYRNETMEKFDEYINSLNKLIEKTKEANSQ